MDTGIAKINRITDEVSTRVQDALGDKLRKIILYGSYARGDYNEESDVDVMVLADINDEEFQIMEKVIWSIGWAIGFEHDVMVSVFLKNTGHFYEWMDVMAYYRNIAKDGVVLYG